MLFFIGCKPKKANLPEWSQNIEGHITSSSPVATDLNEDGILDIVVGSGGEEWEVCQYGVIAFDGTDGSVLWSVPAKNQIVGTAMLYDLTQDGIDDIVIGGRSAELMAINGKNGAVIWRFFNEEGRFAARNNSLYNFYNGQWVPDADNDGVNDIVICNGGDGLIAAGMKYRPPGKLMLLSGKTGKIINQIFMPDKEETYFSPVLFRSGVIFGTGGETRKGSLYYLDMKDLVAGDSSKSIIIDTVLEKGFIAPPVIVDMNNDGQKDLVINAVKGRTSAYDGKDFKRLWQVDCPGTEIYSQPAIGNFYGNDSFPDVIAHYSYGTYPYYNKTLIYIIEGKTGEVVLKKDHAQFTYASPLVVDWDGDKRDEVIFCTMTDSLQNGKEIPTVKLQLFNIYNNEINSIKTLFNTANFSSTPLVSNLNGTESSIILCTQPAVTSFFPGNTSFQKPPLKLIVHKISLPFLTQSQIKWGSYLGNERKSSVD